MKKLVNKNDGRKGRKEGIKQASITHEKMTRGQKIDAALLI